jgi:hypothetical protein
MASATCALRVAAATHPTCVPSPTLTPSYVEHKLELDALRAAADKMQARLDETHAQLASEVARRLSAEEAASRAALEAGRVRELAAQIAAERWVPVQRGGLQSGATTALAAAPPAVASSQQGSLRLARSFA